MAIFLWLLLQLVTLFEDGSLLISIAGRDFSTCLISAWGC